MPTIDDLTEYDSGSVLFHIIRVLLCACARSKHTRIMASGGTSNGSGKSHLPPWELKPETVLVRRNQEESLRGSRAPRPLAPPIFATSTYVLENAKEGEILSNTDAAVRYEH